VSIPGRLASNKLALCGIYKTEHAGSRVALVIPVLGDVFYPRVGIATLDLQEGLRIDVVYPTARTAPADGLAGGTSRSRRADERQRRGNT
jgi:hypothetical protein